MLQSKIKTSISSIFRRRSSRLSGGGDNSMTDQSIPDDESKRKTIHEAQPERDPNELHQVFDKSKKRASSVLHDTDTTEPVSYENFGAKHLGEQESLETDLAEKIHDVLY